MHTFFVVVVVNDSAYVTIQATLSKDARVDFMVLLCARCAKILTGDEPATEVSAIVVTRGAGSDFESASQVGSHASFPQWEVGTEVGKYVLLMFFCDVIRFDYLRGMVSMLTSASCLYLYRNVFVCFIVFIHLISCRL